MRKPTKTRYGEGQKYLGAIMVTTGADGNADIIATLGNVPAGQFITATATRPGYNTSEFSQSSRSTREHRRRPVGDRDLGARPGGGGPH